MTGPVHVTAEVIASRKAGAYRHLTLVAPGVAERFRPGTFLAASVGESLLARRALWIHRVKPSGGYGATLEVVVAPVGEGTRRLARLPVGSRFAVTGPLGRPFALPKERARCLLVGEGYSAAPLFPLAERLRERDCPVTLVIGATDEEHLLNALEARRTAGTVTVVTQDGSVGERGQVADAVSAAVAGADVVYAAGPVPLLGHIAQAAELHGVWSQLALERPLTCATGLCHGCPVPVTGEDGADHVVRACFDGPVFRGDRVRWEALC
jgi:dihydroorotate dehydrogenase electron transfer subunit